MAHRKRTLIWTLFFSIAAAICAVFYALTVQIDNDIRQSVSEFEEFLEMRRVEGMYKPPTGDEPSLESYAADDSGLPARPPFVAGKFYPASSEALSESVRRSLSVESDPADLSRMVLAPHAGYMYSGAVAGRSFAALDPELERVILIASNHNGGARFSGISLPETRSYATPLGETPLDRPTVDALREDPLFVSVPEAHEMHMLEVELPFLRARLDSPYRIVPLIAGRMNAQQIETAAQRLAQLMEDRKTGLVVSLDWSHFYPMDRAVQLDTACIQSLLAGNRREVARCETDGNQVLLIAMSIAQRMGWEPKLLAQANSGDVTGLTDRVVGYASLVWPDGRPRVGAIREDPDARKALLEVARKSVEQAVLRRTAYEPPNELLDRFPYFADHRGVFVTLTIDGKLRGCIGHLQPVQSLLMDVRDNAIAAAVKDRRFRPVKPEELEKIDIEVSLLDLPKPLAVAENAEVTEMLRPHIDGVILKHQGRRSTFLPSVWEDLPNPETFLSRLCKKQGSPADCWKSPDAEFEIYGTYAFDESGKISP